MTSDILPYIFTNAKSIFDTITASKRLRELRMMNKITDGRRAYKQDNIRNVFWVRSQQNIADSFTQHNGILILNELMHTGKLNFVIGK